MENLTWSGKIMLHINFIKYWARAIFSGFLLIFVHIKFLVL